MTALIRQKPWLIAAVILLALLLALFVPTTYVSAAVGVLLLLSAVAVGRLFRKHPSHSVNKRQVLLLLLACAALFQMLRFISGIYFGFYTNYPILSVPTFFLFILPYAGIVVASEFLRSAFLGQNSRAMSVLSYLICLLGELAMAGGLSALGDRYQFLNVFVQTLLPALLANLVYHYISRRYGAHPIVAYRLVLSVIPACLPIAPAVPEALEALLSILLPFGVWLFIGALYEKRFHRATKRTSPWTYVGTGAMMMLSCLFVLLVTGQFAYGLMVIATPSMEGAIDVGDVVFYEKYDGDDPIAVEDVVMYSTDGYITVVHRVVDIQQINGTLRYITKGDANEDVDFGYITADRITGLVRFRIPYLGNASLWFRELFN